MSLPKLAAKSNLGVLALSMHEVEWLDYDARGNPRYASAPVEGNSAADMVSAALAVREAAGGQAKQVILALRDGIVHQSLVELPALGRRELSKVMLRKAKQACGDPEEPPLYSSVQHALTLDEDRSRWSLAAMDRPLVRGFVMGLRRNGVRTKRITAVALSLLNRAAEFQSKEGDADAEVGIEGTVCVAVGLKTVKISLFAGEDLYGVESLEGNLLQTPHLVASILQSVKTTAGFWRKTQRGSRVRDVLVIGLNPDRGLLLANAIRIALPEARIHRWPEPLESGEEQEPHQRAELDEHLGRIATLEACRIDGPFTPKLTFPIPMRQSRAAACIASALILSVSVFGFVKSEVDKRVGVLESDIVQASKVTRKIGELEQTRSQALAASEIVALTLDRSDELERAGVHYDRILSELFMAFHGKAELLSVSVGRVRENASEVSLRAIARGTAVSAIEDISRLERALAQVEGLREVDVDLPSKVDSESGRVELGFSIRAYMEDEL